MGTHPIFESDFDCLTEMSTSRTVEPPSEKKIESTKSPEETLGVIDAQFQFGDSSDAVKEFDLEEIKNIFVEEGSKRLLGKWLTEKTSGQFEIPELSQNALQELVDDICLDEE